MASETPAGRQTLSMGGLLLGFLVGSVVVWVTLNDVLESEPVLQISFLRQIAYAIGWLVGGSIGGITQLQRQGRTAVIPWFLALLAGEA